MTLDFYFTCYRDCEKSITYVKVKKSKSIIIKERLSILLCQINNSNEQSFTISSRTFVVLKEFVIVKTIAIIFKKIGNVFVQVLKKISFFKKSSFKRTLTVAILNVVLILGFPSDGKAIDWLTYVSPGTTPTTRIAPTQPSTGRGAQNPKKPQSPAGGSNEDYDIGEIRNQMKSGKKKLCDLAEEKDSSDDEREINKCDAQESIYIIEEDFATSEIQKMVSIALGNSKISKEYKALKKIALGVHPVNVSKNSSHLRDDLFIVKG